MTARRILLLLSVAGYLTCGCSPDMAGSGSGTQTTNGIRLTSRSGVVSGYVFSVDSDDSLKETPSGTLPVALFLFSSDYQPYDDAGYTTEVLANDEGAFVLDTLFSGTFSLMAYTVPDSQGLYMDAIPVYDSITGYTVRKNFSSCGMISGTIHDVSQAKADQTGAYIIGTPFFMLTDSIGSFSFRSVPAGTYTVRSDYFTVTQGRSIRVKGYIPVPDSLVSDTLIIYSDSISVDVRSDSLVHRVELSL